MPGVQFKSIGSLIMAILLTSGFGAVSFPAVCQTTSYYVALNGDDHAQGTLSSPLKSLDAAIRLAKINPQKTPVSIFMRAGEYFFSKTISISMANWDSARSLTISNYGNETVSFSGAVALDEKKAGLVRDPLVLKRLTPGARQHVLVLDLKAQNVPDPGVLHQAGFGHDVVPSQGELFINGQPLRIARSPNTGKLNIGAVSSAGPTGKDKNTGSSGAIFEYDYPRSAQWSQDAVQNLWVSGYFNIGWSDETAPVGKLTNGNTIQLASATMYGVKSSISGPDNTDRDRLSIRGFYFFNILDELDTAGEYFIDRQNSLLYFWPEEESGQIQLRISNLSSPLISLANVSGITLKGIQFGYTRGTSVEVKNAGNISFLDDTFSNLGTNGIVTKNCHGCIFDHCRIFNTGSSGIVVDGGDRINLVSSGNIISNSEFYKDGRIFRSFNPPVRLNGVGSTVTNCYFHDLAGQAILYQGNNHVIVNNHFDNVCREFSDVGAVGTGRDPSSAGTLIKNNFFENITCPPDLMVNAIYIDDGSGGIKVENNVFSNCGTGGNDHSNHGFGAIHINGGSDNDFSNNIFINARMAFSGGAWGDKQWKDYINNDYIKKTTTRDVNIFSSAYQRSYPFLKDFFNPDRKRTNNINNSLTYNVDKFSGSNITTVINLDAEENAKLRSLHDYTSIVNFFNTTGYPQKVRSWPGWSPVAFDKIGIKPGK